LFEDRSVLLIPHRFSTVRSADRIYVLSEERVVESGTHEELVARGVLGSWPTGRQGVARKRPTLTVPEPGFCSS
jgi:ABC-type multidrug transport system ATPase subunit